MKTTPFRLFSIAAGLLLSLGATYGESAEQSLSRLEASAKELKGGVDDSYCVLSAAIAEEHGVALINQIMARCEKQSPDSYQLYLPLLALLPREDANVGLTKYKNSGTDGQRRCAEILLRELGRPGQRQFIARIQSIANKLPPLTLYTIVDGADVALEDPRGTMLINDGTEEHPIPRYIIGIKSSRTLIDTRDLSTFRSALQTLQEPQDVFLYDSCTMPRSWGLTDAQKNEFRESFALSGHTLRDEVKRTTCYCSRMTATTEEPSNKQTIDSAPQPPKPMRPTSLPNTVDYVETPSRDLPKTKAFFAALFGWQFTEYGPDYLDYSDGRTTGGFYRSEKVSSYEGGSTIAVIYTEHLEELRDHAKELGATITRDIFSFPGGRRFHFTEPGGSEFAIWSDK